MGFGLAGAHRSGKTTLAKDIAERGKMHLHEASVSALAREIGVNSVAELPILQRIEVQEHILSRFIEDFVKAPRPCVTDRTPLDMAAYMLGEVTMHNTSEIEDRAINAYVQRCLDETARHFDAVVITRPLADYAYDPKSPPPNRSYQRGIQFLIEGAANQLNRQLASAVLTTNDHESRVEYSMRFFTDRLCALREEHQGLMLN
jgi:predicted ATPase